MIPAVSPFCIAIAQKQLLTIGRLGSPKEIFDTPRTVLTPNSSRTLFNASRVTFAPSFSELMVMVSTSITISFLSIPYLAASLMILPATRTRPSASFGIPSSSMVSPTTTPPYFRIRGKTSSIETCFPFTELIIGFPLQIRIARSIAFPSTVSI